MIRKITLSIFLTLAGLSSAAAAALPGFSLKKLGDADGFITSLTLRNGSELYYSSATGEVYRFAAGKSSEVARFDTAVDGNAVLLGVIFRGPNELLAHYVAKDMSADVIESVDLESQERRMIARLACNLDQPCSSEHHGGNLSEGPGGSIFFGIGDYGTRVAAQDPSSPGGKVYRLLPDNTLQLFATGVRNPYDMAWDHASERLVLADNGPTAGDEMNLITEGANCGWPSMTGLYPPIEGFHIPEFVFDETVAPTGLIVLSGPRGYAQRGLLLATYWDKSLFYFNAPPKIGRPVRLLDSGPRVVGQTTFAPHHDVPLLGDALIDVVQDIYGTVFIATTGAIYELRFPIPGDANGDGVVDANDAEALSREILDGDGSITSEVHKGTFVGSWGADANVDGFVDARDLVALAKMRGTRKRPVH